MQEQVSLKKKRTIAEAVMAIFEKEELPEVDALEVAVNIYGYVCLLCEVPEEEAIAAVAKYYRVNGGSSGHASH